MMKLRALMIVLIFQMSIAWSSSTTAMESMPARLVTMYAGDDYTPSYMAPPSEPSMYTSMVTEINVTYVGFPADAQAAFQKAVDIWKNFIFSSVPIEILAFWTPLGPGVLGSAGPIGVLRDFSGGEPDRWHPPALANKLAGVDLVPSQPDIITAFNSDFPSWDFGLDGTPEMGTYDFVSVVLHELGHGLGFSSEMAYDSGIGGWGFVDSSPPPHFPGVLTFFAENDASQRLIDDTLFSNPSPELGDQLTSGNLFFGGSRAVAANGGILPVLYAPSTWDDGSSFSHLDETVYGPGDINSLMTPILNQNEVIHHPGPITIGILHDMGWNLEASDLSIDILANGSDIPISVSSEESVVLTVSLDPGMYVGQESDWWIYAVTPFGQHSYLNPEGWQLGIDSVLQAPLVAFSGFEVLNSPLPAGTYTIYFAVDDNKDGILDATWFDSVQVQVE